ncbi:MAG: HlyD family type I secretion periplasmic adaptor subunit [Magnetococcales bacterium]|nr:HlyD family type I secretion periplasmic adaptor subunit [Magnetococcales bacterium]
MMSKYKLTHYLTEALVLEEGGFSWKFRLALLGSVAVFMLAVFVASLVEVNEAVMARGQFRPRSFVHKVQPSEGGIVDEILVKEGDLVAKGALLLRLKNATTTANQEQMEGRLSGLKARAARLTAFMEGTEADFSGIDARHKDLIQDQAALLRSQNQSRQAGRWVFTTQEEQKRAEIAQAEEEIKNARSRGEVNESLLTLQDKLAKKNLVSRMAQLEAKRTVITSSGEIRSLEARLNKARSSLQEVIMKRQAFENDIQTQANQELGNVKNEIAEMQEALSKLVDRKKRLDILAPVAGRVQNLRFRSIGAVVGVGDLLLQVIPADDELTLDLNIAPKDIGFVHPGQPVVIRVTSFDFDRYGTVGGDLVATSPFTYLDNDKQVSYKGEVHPKSRTVGRSGQQYFILPGMWADAEIITGSRSLLDYLLKPLLSPLTSAIAGPS